MNFHFYHLLLLYLLADEMSDILLYATPKSWSREMDRQGWDPVIHTPSEIVEFMERIESTEDFDAGRAQSKIQSKGKKSSGNGKSKSSGGASGTKYCLIHGTGNHSSDDCHKLQAEAKRLKSGNQKPSGNQGGYGNKTWSKKANDDRKKNQQELNALVKKNVKKELNAIGKKKMKELNAVSKKRKSSLSDDDSLDLAVLENASLKDFNCTDMDNLQIDDLDEKSQGEVSV